IQGGATSVPAAVQEVGNATLMLIPRSPDVMSRTQVRHFPGFGELHVCAKSARCINFNYEMCDAWPHRNACSVRFNFACRIIDDDCQRIQIDWFPI
ncbi:MAG TPA: hypothetical protein PLY87_30035, partial [Planctomycetaceae bacterium]|nr:hypothetical protein [Planctomycetaceae bacterium]